MAKARAKASHAALCSARTALEKATLSFFAGLARELGRWANDECVAIAKAKATEQRCEAARLVESIRPRARA